MNAEFRQTRASWPIGLIGVAITMAVTSAAQAAVLVSNIDEPRRDASTIQEDPDAIVTLPWGAQSFTTDSHAYVLDTIDVWLGDLAGAPTIVAELRDDQGLALPATLLTTFSLSPPIGAGAATLTTLTPNSPVNLAANAIYWVVFGAHGTGSYTWEYAEGNNQTGPGSIGTYVYSDDRGATWTNFGSDNPFKLTVNATVAPVPVPAVAALFGAGVAGLLTRRRIQAGAR